MSQKLRGIYYDTETTGVSSSEDRIIEIAAMDCATGETFHALINPSRDIPQGATAVHGITNEMVAQAPLFGQVAQDFIAFCGTDCVLIAHNNDAFDQQFLKEEFNRHNVPLPQWSYIDTLKWARKYRPDLPRHGLQFLREFFNIPANQAHRALDDVIILREVFKKMIDDLSYEQVLKLLQQKKDIVRMPFGKHQGKLLKDVPKNYVSWLVDQGALDKPENSSLKDSFRELGLLASTS